MLMGEMQSARYWLAMWLAGIGETSIFVLSLREISARILFSAKLRKIFFGAWKTHCRPPEERMFTVQRSLRSMTWQNIIGGLLYTIKNEGSEKALLPKQ